MGVNDNTMGSGYPVQGGDLPCKNTDGSNDLVAGDLVTLDTTNIISTSQPIIGVVRATTDDVCFGICVDAIPKGKMGRVRTAGVAVGRAGQANSNVITAKDWVEADTNGNLKTTAGGKNCLGIALNTTAALNDQVMVLVSQAKDA